MNELHVSFCVGAVGGDDANQAVGCDGDFEDSHVDTLITVITMVITYIFIILFILFTKIMEFMKIHHIKFSARS